MSDRGYRDVGSPEAKARIWREAREQAERDSEVLKERLRSRTSRTDVEQADDRKGRL